MEWKKIETAPKNKYKMVKAFSFYKQSSLKKIIINLFGKDHQEKDEFFYL